MWVNTRIYGRLAADSEQKQQVEGALRILAEQNKVLQVNLDWLRTRVSQLERERALMLYKFTGVKIETPEFQPVVAPDAADMLNAVNAMFQDVGDEQAARLGIEHLPDGTLKAE